MNLKKCIAAGLCVLSMTSVFPGIINVQAASIEATNRIEVKEEKTDADRPLTFKERIAKIQEKDTDKKNTEVIPQGHAYVAEDTILRVRLTEEISSKTMHKGDKVPLVLQDNLIINGVVVIPEGTEVTGIVTKAKKNGMFGRSGKLEFSINSVRTINGIDIPLQYLIKKEAGSDGGAVAVATAVSLIGGLFMKGKNVSFPEGSVFEARVTKDTDLNVTLDQLAEAMDPTKPHGVEIILK